MAESTLTLTRDDLFRLVVRHWKGDDVARAGTDVNTFKDGTVDVSPVGDLVYSTGTLSISSLSDGTQIATLAGGVLPGWVNIDLLNNGGASCSASVTVDGVDYGRITNASGGGTGFIFRQQANPAPAANPATWELRFTHPPDDAEFASLVEFSDAAPSWIFGLDSSDSLILSVSSDESAVTKTYLSSLAAGGFYAGILHSLDYTGEAFVLTRYSGGTSTTGFLSDAETRIVEDCVRSGYRRFLFPPVLPGESTAYRWSFLEPSDVLILDPPFSDGTIEAVDGSVTISGASWPAWASFGELVADGGNYEVVSVAGNTLVVDTPLNLPPGTTFQLLRFRYRLPDDWGAMQGDLSFAPSGEYGGMSLRQISPAAFLAYRARLRLAGHPAYYAIVPVSPKADEEGQRWELQIFPASDRQRTLHYRYSMSPDAMVSGDALHYGGAIHTETLQEAVLFAWEELLEGIQNGVHAGAFMRALQSSISYDRIRRSPDYIGPNVDRSDSHDPGSNYVGGPGREPISLHCGGLIINVNV